MNRTHRAIAAALKRLPSRSAVPWLTLSPRARRNVARRSEMGIARAAARARYLRSCPVLILEAKS